MARADRTQAKLNQTQTKIRLTKGNLGSKRKKREKVFVNSQVEPVQEPNHNGPTSELEHGEMPKSGECFKCCRQGRMMSDCTFHPHFRLYCFGCGQANTIKPN